MATWLITGCSTGLGRAFAEAVLHHGDNVVATARDVATVQDLTEAHPESALALALDVTERAQIIAAISSAEARFGHVDVLVNNAGYGYRAAVEEGETDQLQQLFATNFFGAVEMIKAVLPGMRARRAGTIINISSIGARISPVGSGYYAATKAALEAMTASLRKELAPLGITAMIVEPGAFRTDFAGRSLTESATPIEDYDETAGRRRKAHDTSDGTQLGDPARAARALIAVATGPNPPLMLVLGPDALRNFRESLEDLNADISAFEGASNSTSFSD